MKVKNIIFLSLILVMVSSAFSKDYINEQYGISLNIPDDWKVIAYEELPLEKQQKLKADNRQSETLAICGIKRPDEFNMTTLIIQFQNFKEIQLNDAIKELKSEHGKEMMISLAELFALDCFGGRLKTYSIVKSDSDFDKSKNISFGKIYYHDPDKGDFVAMVSKILYKGGLVTLQSFAFGSEVANFESTINKTIDSLKFDSVSASENTPDKMQDDVEEVKHHTNDQNFDKIWKWAGIILTASIVLGFIRMVLRR